MAGSTPASVTADPTASPPPARRPVSVSPWAEAWRRFKRHRMAYFSLWVLALLVLAVLLGPLIYKVGINDIDFKARLVELPIRPRFEWNRCSDVQHDSCGEVGRQDGQYSGRQQLRCGQF